VVDDEPVDEVDDDLVGLVPVVVFAGEVLVLDGGVLVTGGVVTAGVVFAGVVDAGGVVCVVATCLV
jgi:hypothetical protein